MMHCVKFNLTSTCDKRIAASDLLRTNLANRLECTGKLVIGNLGQRNSMPGPGSAQVDHKQYTRSAYNNDSGWDRQCSIIYWARLNTRMTFTASTVTKAESKITSS